MPFAWEDHHFIAGSLAMDFTNTVVFRNDPARLEDRVADPAAFAVWQQALMERADRYAECEGAPAFAAAGLGAAGLKRLLHLREAIDSLLRGIAERGAVDGAAWQTVILAYGKAIPELDFRPGPRGLVLVSGATAKSAPGFTARMAQSALDLVVGPQINRLRACGGCAWLFLDRSKNGRKRWCEMRTCGSRDKARRYYHRQRGV